MKQLRRHAERHRTDTILMTGVGALFDAVV
jgi:hypothetical protein